MEWTGKTILVFLSAALAFACSDSSGFDSMNVRSSAGISKTAESENQENNEAEEEEIPAAPPVVISGSFLTCQISTSDGSSSMVCSSERADLHAGNVKLTDQTGSDYIFNFEKDPATGLYHALFPENLFVFKNLEISFRDKDGGFNTLSVAIDTLKVNSQNRFLEEKSTVTPKASAAPPKLEDNIENQKDIAEVPSIPSPEPEPEPEPPQPEPGNVLKNAVKVNGKYRVLVFENENQAGNPGGLAERAVMGNLISELDQDQANGLDLSLEYIQVNGQTVDVESLKNAALVIWNDYSYQIGGISDSVVNIIYNLYNSGIPVYAIGDDLGFSITQNLGDDARQLWSQVIHLSASPTNGPANQPVLVEAGQSTHKVLNSDLYGAFTGFTYSLDPDDQYTATQSGETLLATLENSGAPALLSYDGNKDIPPVVTQCFLVSPGSGGVESRKILFKNAVTFLLQTLTTK